MERASEDIDWTELDLQLNQEKQEDPPPPSFNFLEILLFLY